MKKYLIHCIVCFGIANIFLTAITITNGIEHLKKLYPNAKSLGIKDRMYSVDGIKTNSSIFEFISSGNGLFYYSLVGIALFLLLGFLLKIDFVKLKFLLSNKIKEVFLKYLPHLLVIILVSAFIEYFFKDLLNSPIIKTPYSFLFFLPAAIIIPVFEELIFRFSLIEYFLGKFKSENISIILTALIFAIGHFYYGPIAVLVIILPGLLFGYIRVKESNISVPIIFHIINNSLGLIISYFF